MTDNLPALVGPDASTPTREITTADVDSWISVASDVIRLANLIAPTAFVPKSLRDSAPATAAAILYGREVGLPPMTALTQTHVIEGKPAMSAEAMRGLVLAAGHDLEVVETTRARCVMRGRRYGREKWTEIAVSIDEFAHLRAKDNWRNYPRQMLQARATAELCRLAFPDIIHGFRAVEEFDDTLEDAAEQPAGPTTRVTRTGKKAAAKKTTPAPLEERSERPALAGPPLPGEEGFEPASAPSNVGGSAVHEPAETTDGADVSEPVTEEDGGNPGGPSTEPGNGSPGGEGEGEASEPPGDPADAPTPIRGPRKASAAQKRMIFGLLGPLDVTTDEDRHDVATAIVGHRVDSFADLTADNAKTIIDTLGRVTTREDLDALLAAAAGGES